MASVSDFRAGDSAVFTGAATCGSLLDECFAYESRAANPQIHQRPRQILLRVLLAELNAQESLDVEDQLPWRLEKSRSLVLCRGDELFERLASLQETKALRVLAEPVFCVQSGRPAHAQFQAGEFPTLAPSPRRQGKPDSMTIGFHKYGTDLEVTPRVLPDRTLRLTLAVRQTCPDPGKGHRIGDVLLPGLSVRAAIAEAEMPCGNTLLMYAPAEPNRSAAAAGLLVLATAGLVRQNAAATLLDSAF